MGVGHVPPGPRFAKNVKVLTFKDVNVEELSHSEIEPPSRRLIRADRPLAPYSAAVSYPGERTPAVPEYVARLRCRTLSARKGWIG